MQTSQSSDDEYKKHLYALIIVGGGGTRLWPRSRNATPKQFLKLFNNKTLAQITTARLHKMVSWEKMIVVTTTEQYRKEIIKEVPDLLPENVLVEPLRRNTAPAHGLGAIFIRQKDPNAVIVNSYSDQLISPDDSYIETMLSAAEAAYSGDFLIATGLRPTYPNIGYGYIKRGKEWKLFGHKYVYVLEKFTEKPELKVAERYVASGDYFWNTAGYVWRADSLLNALKKNSTEIYEALEKISLKIDTKDQSKAIEQGYKEMPDISIDYAVSEKATNFYLVVAEYNWIDIGDWKEVWENLPKDANGNVVIKGDEGGGEIINIDTTDALIHTDGRLIAVVDVDNLIIVDTKDALLVTTKSRAQSVKKIVEKLKADKRTELL